MINSLVSLLIQILKLQRSCSVPDEKNWDSKDLLHIKMRSMTQHSWPLKIPVLKSFRISCWTEARGRISLRGDSIYHTPIIEYTFLKSERDMEVFLRGINETLALAQTKPFQRMGARINDTPLPDCKRHAFGSESYWRCFIRHMVRNNCHISSSAKMGPESDPQAVLDPELRVYGINKLRVADSSITPTQIAGHSQAVTYLLGRRWPRS